MPSPITNTGNPNVLDQAIEDIVTELQQPMQDNVASSMWSQPFVHRLQNNNNNNNNSNINHGTLILDPATTSNQVLENQLLSLVQQL